MTVPARRLLLLALLGALLLPSAARADDPPTVDVLALLGLEPAEDAAGLVAPGADGDSKCVAGVA